MANVIAQVVHDATTTLLSLGEASIRVAWILAFAGMTPWRIVLAYLCIDNHGPGRLFAFSSIAWGFAARTSRCALKFACSQSKLQK